jgi:formylglycine-generating enzyme required for sulfatase activity
VVFLMGSPATEAGRQESERQHGRRIGRTFALAAKPVTVEQYRRFERGYQLPAVNAQVADLPVVATDWHRAARYCNWLSAKEGIAEGQWCYVIKGDEIGIKENHLTLAGYRLPTEAEMEYATRAGAVTSRYYGETDDLLPKYAWYVKNALDSPQAETWAVGSLKPNDFGLFDAQGNVFVWCQECYGAYPRDQGECDDKEDGLSVDGSVTRVLRGGSFYNHASLLRSASRYDLAPTFRRTNVGFRVARTMP